MMGRSQWKSTQKPKPQSQKGKHVVKTTYHRSFPKGATWMRKSSDSVRVLLEGRKPEQWSIMNIISIPKSGDLSKGVNYREISLCSLVAKTYNRMILNRICPSIKPYLRINKNDFRSGRTTTSQILALRR